MFLLVRLCHNLLSTTEEALLSDFSILKKADGFSFGLQSWEHRSKLLSESFLLSVLSVDLLNKVPEAFRLEAPTSLPAMLKCSSVPAPPIKDRLELHLLAHAPITP